jgi:hypothetical protein
MKRPTDCADCEHSRTAETGTIIAVLCDAPGARHITVTTFPRKGTRLHLETVAPPEWCPWTGEGEAGV